VPIDIQRYYGTSEATKYPNIRKIHSVSEAPEYPHMREYGNGMQLPPVGQIFFDGKFGCERNTEVLR